MYYLRVPYFRKPPYDARAQDHAAPTHSLKEGPPETRFPEGLGFRVCTVCGAWWQAWKRRGFRVSGLGFRAQGLRLRVVS